MSRAIVYLWGIKVGVIDDDDGTPKFAYYPDFRKSQLEISPFKMPLSIGSVMTFSELARKSFQGLPGIFADSLPDSFGNKIIENYFRIRYGKKGKTNLSPVEKLLYVGNRGMGALEYRPAHKIDETNDGIDLAKLVDASRKIIKGDIDKDAASLLHVGESAGGARSKALVGWNPKTNEFIAGTKNLPNNFEHWILKIDGTEDGGHSGSGRSEYAYAMMALEAGIEVPEARLVKDGDLTHFMIKRFDRSGGKKIQMSSLSGLIHSDFNEPRTVGYEDLLNVVNHLTKDRSALAEGFRRMVFNVIARNQDDHVKNISFLMDENRKWRLSPAYDLTFSVGRGLTSSHQMTVNGKSDEINSTDVMRVAEKFEIADAYAIVSEVRAAVLKWRGFAKKAGVEEDRIARIGSLLEAETARFRKTETPTAQKKTPQKKHDTAKDVCGKPNLDGSSCRRKGRCPNHGG